MRLRLWFGLWFALWFGWLFAFLAEIKCSICSYQLSDLRRAARGHSYLLGSNVSALCSSVRIMRSVGFGRMLSVIGSCRGSRCTSAVRWAAVQWCPMNRYAPPSGTMLAASPAFGHGQRTTDSEYCRDISPCCDISATCIIRCTRSHSASVLPCRHPGFCSRSLRGRGDGSSVAPQWHFSGISTALQWQINGPAVARLWRCLQWHSRGGGTVRTRACPYLGHI